MDSARQNAYLVYKSRDTRVCRRKGVFGSLYALGIPLSDKGALCFNPPPHYTGANQMFGYRTMSASLSVGRSSLWTMNTLTTHTHTHTHTQKHTHATLRGKRVPTFSPAQQRFSAQGAHRSGAF